MLFRSLRPRGVEVSLLSQLPFWLLHICYLLVYMWALCKPAGLVAKLVAQSVIQKCSDVRVGRPGSLFDPYLFAYLVAMLPQSIKLHHVQLLIL